MRNLNPPTAQRIKRDAHGLWLRHGDSVYRPVATPGHHYDYLFPHDGTRFAEGQKVLVEPIKKSHNMIKVSGRHDESWEFHGFIAQRVGHNHVKIDSEQCWRPKES